jgi:aspartyl protease family protein
VLNLQRVVGGHYAVEGSINQVPINFMVDTGATITAVSSDFAKHAGVTDCEPYKTQTANGVVNVCLGTAREMTIGQFRLKNVKVSYSNGLGNTFLLGMNVIGQFRMEQQGDVMRLTLH